MALGLTRELRHVEMSGVEYLKCVLGPPIKYLLNLSSTFPYTLDTEPQNVRPYVLFLCNYIDIVSLFSFFFY